MQHLLKFDLYFVLSKGRLKDHALKSPIAYLEVSFCVPNSVALTICGVKYRDVVLYGLELQAKSCKS